MNNHKLIKLIMIFGIVLTGCTSPAATTFPSVSTEPSKPAPVATKPAPVTPVTLRFWSWRLNVDPGFDILFAKSKAEFEASHPGVTIEAHAEPYDGYVNKITSVLAAGDPPEIIHVPAATLHNYTNQDWFEPLNKYLSDTDIIQSFSSAQNWCKIGNEYFCVVLEAYGMAALVNEEILAEAGVKWPDKPISAAEFTDLVKKLTLDRNKDGVTDVYGLGGFATASESSFALKVLHYMYLNGVHYYDKTGKIDVTRPEVVDALKEFKEAYDSGAIPKGMNNNDCRRLFHEEKAAFFIDGTWAMDLAIKANPSLATKVKVYPIPSIMNIGAVSNILALPAGGKHNDLAWDFIKLWTRQDYQEIYAAELGLPLRGGIVTKELMAKKPWLAVYEDALKKSINYIPPSYETLYAKFSSLVINRGLEIVVLNKPVEETLNALQKEIDALKP